MKKKLENHWSDDTHSIKPSDLFGQDGRLSFQSLACNAGLGEVKGCLEAERRGEGVGHSPTPGVYCSEPKNRAESAPIIQSEQLLGRLHQHPVRSVFKVILKKHTQMVDLAAPQFSCDGVLMTPMLHHVSLLSSLFLTLPSLSPSLF